MHGTALTKEENIILIGFLEAATALVRLTFDSSLLERVSLKIKIPQISSPVGHQSTGSGSLDQDFYNLATHDSAVLDKMYPGGKIIAGLSCSNAVNFTLLIISISFSRVYVYT